MQAAPVEQLNVVRTVSSAGHQEPGALTLGESERELTPRALALKRARRDIHIALPALLLAKDMQRDRAFVLECIKIGYRAMWYADPELSADRDFMLQAVRTNLQLHPFGTLLHVEKAAYYMLQCQYILQY